MNTAEDGEGRGREEEKRTSRGTGGRGETGRWGELRRGQGWEESAGKRTKREIGKEENREER